MRARATWTIAGLLLAVGCSIGQLVSSEGDQCLNDGNCPSGQSCCDGKCSTRCRIDDPTDDPQYQYDAALTVNVVSDLAPVVDFDALHTILEDGSEVIFPLTVAMHFDKARPIATFVALREGIRTARVALSKNGDVIMDRQVRLFVRTDTNVTLMLTRSCTLMSCPASGDALDATVCHDGRCVTPSCSSMDPAACGPATCSTDGDCEPSVACARATCVDGTCIERGDDTLCGSGMDCRVPAGCVARTTECDGPEDCDDAIRCTLDACYGGLCSNLSDSSLCGAGACDPFADDASATTGCTPPPCGPDNCLAGPCQRAECVANACVVTSVCAPSEQCCGGVCAADCSAPQPCAGKSAGTVCRAATGPCDAAEVCDGVSVGCPADGFLPATTTCRPVNGVCDVA